MKQHQHRPPTRAPRNNPEFPKRIASWVTEEQYDLFNKNGGSGWLRKILDRELKKEKE